MRFVYLPVAKNTSEYKTRFAWFPTRVGTNAIGIGAVAWLEFYEEKEGPYDNTPNGQRACDYTVDRRPINAPEDWVPAHVQKNWAHD